MKRRRSWGPRTWFLIGEVEFPIRTCRRVWHRHQLGPLIAKIFVNFWKIRTALKGTAPGDPLSPLFQHFNTCTDVNVLLFAAGGKMAKHCCCCPCFVGFCSRYRSDICSRTPTTVSYRTTLNLSWSIRIRLTFTRTKRRRRAQLKKNRWPQ